MQILTAQSRPSVQPPFVLPLTASELYFELRYRLCSRCRMSGAGCALSPDPGAAPGNGAGTRWKRRGPCAAARPAGRETSRKRPEDEANRSRSGYPEYLSYV